MRHDNFRSAFVFSLFTTSSTAFFRSSSLSVRSRRRRLQLQSSSIDNELGTTTTTTSKVQKSPPKKDDSNPDYWKIAPSLMYPEPRPLTPALQEALETNTHPVETQEELGYGISLLCDWRENWYTYESPIDNNNNNLIDPKTGVADYICDEIEGNVPDDLVGTLYRNGPGKFGVNNERVQHVLDADALVYKLEFSASSQSSIRFRSRFVETQHFRDEQAANRFLYRGTFGTGPTFEGLDGRPKNGLNADPLEPSTLSKIVGGAFNTNIKSKWNCCFLFRSSVVISRCCCFYLALHSKLLISFFSTLVSFYISFQLDSANTQIISFGGKLLALFEAGLPHRLDPNTLETLGEDTMGGTLKSALPVKLENVPEEAVPDFLGGSAVRFIRNWVFFL